MPETAPASVPMSVPTSAPASLDQLREILVGCGSVLVAFSGGADSSFLAWVANDTLGPERCDVVTAVSPSLAGAEHADCERLAAEWNLRWRAVSTNEMDNAAYRVNDTERCFHCKSALMDAVEPTMLAAADRSDVSPVVVLGVNLDDLTDHRPGQRAASERGARFPLVEAGFTKADIREWSQRLGLRTWDKPAAPCLASRLPYGTGVTVALLSQVERAEAALHRLGFGALRVRHYGDTARIEVEAHALADVVARRAEVTAAVHAVGYRYVTVDLDGLRSGNLNQT
jgi:pyridinium-3,5-biscarboxylic acid mononucleotide sulfurtransferase